MTYATINPYTGDTVATFPDATDEAVQASIIAVYGAAAVRV